MDLSNISFLINSLNLVIISLLLTLSKKIEVFSIRYSFISMVITGFLWSVLGFLTRLEDFSDAQYLLLGRATLSCSLLLLIAFMSFLISFSGGLKKNIQRYIFGSMTSVAFILFIITNFTEMVVKKIEFNFHFNDLQVEYGQSYFYLLAFYSLGLFYSIWKLYTPDNEDNSDYIYKAQRSSIAHILIFAGVVLLLYHGFLPLLSDRIPPIPLNDMVILLCFINFYRILTNGEKIALLKQVKIFFRYSPQSRLYFEPFSFFSFI